VHMIYGTHSPPCLTQAQDVDYDVMQPIAICKVIAINVMQRIAIRKVIAINVMQRIAIRKVIAIKAMQRIAICKVIAIKATFPCFLLILWAHAPEATPPKPLRPLANKQNKGPSSSLAGPIQAFY